MNRASIQASLHNLTQVNRIQHNEHTTPINNQEQNANISQEKASERITKPTEAEQADGKVIDPGNAKKIRLKKKKKKKKNFRKFKKQNRSRETGRFVDFSV
jgi:hypothetical protein